MMFSRNFPIKLRLDLGKDVIYESPLALKDILRKKNNVGSTEEDFYEVLKLTSMMLCHIFSPNEEIENTYSA